MHTMNVLQTVFSIYNEYKTNNDVYNIIVDKLKVLHVVHHCYYTEVASNAHKYIIVRDGQYNYWIECEWKENAGVHLVFSYKDVERLLKEHYKTDAVRTIAHDSFNDIIKNGIELP